MSPLERFHCIADIMSKPNCIISFCYIIIAAPRPHAPSSSHTVLAETNLQNPKLNIAAQVAH